MATVSPLLSVVELPTSWPLTMRLAIPPETVAWMARSKSLMQMGLEMYSAPCVACRTSVKSDTLHKDFLCGGGGGGGGGGVALSNASTLTTPIPGTVLVCTKAV